MKKTHIALAAAAAAVAMAGLNCVLARRAERKYPPMGKFVTVDGIRLHYLEAGDGPPIVLLHGNLITADDWLHSGLLGRLARRHRVIAFDRPGFGYSARPRGRSWTPARQADLLAAAFQELGIERPIVLGHSFGAVTAAALALEHPTSTSGLILIGGYYYPTVRADALLAVPVAIPVIGDVLAWTEVPLAGSALLPLFLKAMFSPKEVPDRFSENYRAGLVMRPWQVRAMSEDGASMIPAVKAMQRRYHEINVPIAIMAGAGDRVVDPDRHSRRLHSELTGSTLRVLPGYGHVVHYQATDAVLAAVEEIEARALDKGLFSLG